MGLMDEIFKRMTDDEGLFQGGKKGRIFGRARDYFEGNRGANANVSRRNIPGAGPAYGMGGEPSISEDVQRWSENPTAQGLKQLKYARAYGGEEGIRDRIEGIRTGKYDIGRNVEDMDFKDIVRYAETSYIDDEGNFQTPEYAGFYTGGLGIGDDEIFSDADYRHMTDTYNTMRKNDPRFFEEFSGGQIYDSSTGKLVGSHGPSHDRYSELAGKVYERGYGYQPFMSEGKYGHSGRGGQYTADDVINALEGEGDIRGVVRNLHSNSPVLRDKEEFRSTRTAIKPTQERRQAAFQEAFDEQMDLYNKLDPRIEDAGY